MSSEYTKLSDPDRCSCLQNPFQLSHKSASINPTILSLHMCLALYDSLDILDFELLKEENYWIYIRLKTLTVSYAPWGKIKESSPLPISCLSQQKDPSHKLEKGKTCLVNLFCRLVLLLVYFFEEWSPSAFSPVALSTHCFILKSEKQSSLFIVISHPSILRGFNFLDFSWPCVKLMCYCWMLHLSVHRYMVGALYMD